MKLILDYRPRRNSGKRRMWRYGMILFCFVITLTVYTKRGPVFRTLRVQYLQWQCGNFSKQDTFIAYEEDSSKGAALAAGDSNYQYENETDWPGLTIWKYHYEPLRELLGFSNDPYGRFFAKKGIVFLHYRRTPAGLLRIVAVDIDTINRALDYLVYEPADWSGSFGLIDRQIERDPLFDRSYPSNLEKPLRLYEGQADSQDQTHFTITYEINNEKGLIDGWLQNDHQINFQVRYGPEADLATTQLVR